MGIETIKLKGDNMEEYLTINELVVRIKYEKQSIYNLIHKNVFVLGKHYLKPTPKKLLFKWSEIRRWLGEPVPSDDESATEKAAQETNSERKVPDHQYDPRSSIRI